MDFIFYDLETTGLSHAFDQPLQFAAIRTDENFVEKERVKIRCQLAPHILPSPRCQRQSKSEPKGSAKCCHFGVGIISV
jgi:exodeoxyribonuclease-1